VRNKGAEDGRRAKDKVREAAELYSVIFLDLYVPNICIVSPVGVIAVLAAGGGGAGGGATG
jgi:hypothetical protein